jgi:hypothetical protein
MRPCLVGLVLCVACSAGGRGGGEPLDLAMPPDQAGPNNAGVVCGNTTCAPGQSCCGNIDSAGAATVACQDNFCSTNDNYTAECDDPEDCTGSLPACCGLFQEASGTPPSCPLSTYGAFCMQSCVWQSPYTSCPNTGEVHLCRRAADCAGETTGRTLCCEYASSVGPIAFCVSSSLQGLAQRCL